MSESVTGVLYIISSPDGHVQAAEADFTQNHPPAYTQDENQERRARNHAWGEVIRNHASGELFKYPDPFRTHFHCKSIRGE